MPKLLEKELCQVSQWRDTRMSGRVVQVIGLLIESIGPEVFVGEVCIVYGKNREEISCQVVGFREDRVILMSFGDFVPIAPGAEVYPTGEVHRIAVSEKLCGRILDALGRPIDGKGDLIAEKFYPVTAPPPPPLSRPPIQELLPTGIRAIDGLCSLGKGQRIGIFSAPGVGKSSLMGMIGRMAGAEINVIALIGERGREVREFIEDELGPEGLARSVVVVATADQAALLRSKGANVATAIAEYFRDLGKHVILMMDSVSRYAMALREIGLAIGEPPTSRGYTPSVFAQLPRLLERAGNNSKGSISGIYTILCEEDELNDPIPDLMRSLLDGHIQLSKELSAKHHFPPIDILKSISRIMHRIVSKEHLSGAGKMRELLHEYQIGSQLVELGAYVSGSKPKLDEAIDKIGRYNAFLVQEAKTYTPFKDVLRELKKL